MIAEILVLVLSLVLALIFMSVPHEIIFGALLRKPILVKFHPDNTVNFKIPKKDEVTSHGFIDKKAGKVYTRKPGTAYVWKGKLIIYPVYDPLGITLSPAWVKVVELLREKGYDKPEDILRELEKLEKKSPTELDEDDVKKYEDLKDVKKILSVFGSTVDFRALDPLVNLKDASQDFSMLENALAQERLSWSDLLKKLNIAPVVLGIIALTIIGIVVVSAILGGGGPSAPNVIQAGATAVKATVEKNAAAAVVNM